MFFLIRRQLRLINTVVHKRTTPSGGSKNFESGGGAEDNLWAPSSFIANAHNDLQAFYTEKGGFSEEKFWANRGCPNGLPLESATEYAS